MVFGGSQAWPAVVIPDLMASGVIGWAAACTYIRTHKSAQPIGALAAGSFGGVRLGQVCAACRVGLHPRSPRVFLAGADRLAVLSDDLLGEDDLAHPATSKPVHFSAATIQTNTVAAMRSTTAGTTTATACAVRRTWVAWNVLKKCPE
jgi:hypothetical protein